MFKKTIAIGLVLTALVISSYYLYQPSIQQQQISQTQAKKAERIKRSELKKLTRTRAWISMDRVAPGQAGLIRKKRGVRVTHIHPDGLMAKLGVQVGDLIVQVNNLPTLMPDTLNKAVSGSIQKFNFPVSVYRKNRPIELLVKLDN